MVAGFRPPRVRLSPQSRPASPDVVSTIPSLAGSQAARRDFFPLGDGPVFPGCRQNRRFAPRAPHGAGAQPGQRPRPPGLCLPGRVPRTLRILAAPGVGPGPRGCQSPGVPDSRMRSGRVDLNHPSGAKRVKSPRRAGRISPKPGISWPPMCAPARTTRPGL